MLLRCTITASQMDRYSSWISSFSKWRTGEESVIYLRSYNRHWYGQDWNVGRSAGLLTAELCCKALGDVFEIRTWRGWSRKPSRHINDACPQKLPGSGSGICTAVWRKPILRKWNRWEGAEREVRSQRWRGRVWLWTYICERTAHSCECGLYVPGVM